MCGSRSSVSEAGVIRWATGVVAISICAHNMVSGDPRRGSAPNTFNLFRAVVAASSCLAPRAWVSSGRADRPIVAVNMPKSALKASKIQSNVRVKLSEKDVDKDKATRPPPD